MSTEYRYLGNFSAVDPAYSRHMQCHECKVSWTGCWDNFQCPECGEGELPTHGVEDGPTDEQMERLREEYYADKERYRKQMTDAGRGHLLPP